MKNKHKLYMPREEIKENHIKCSIKRREDSKRGEKEIKSKYNE